MRSLLIGLAALLALAFLARFAPVTSHAADAPAATMVTGILIDQHCGAGMMKKDDPEAAAAKHTKDCCTADSCAASGYCVIYGKKMLKFDDNGDKLAKDFLAKTDKTDDLRVVVTGTVTDDQIAVTAVEAAPEPTTAK